MSTSLKILMEVTVENHINEKDFAKLSQVLKNMPKINGEEKQFNKIFMSSDFESHKNNKYIACELDGYTSDWGHDIPIDSDFFPHLYMISKVSPIEEVLINIESENDYSDSTSYDDFSEIEEEFNDSIESIKNILDESFDSIELKEDHQDVASDIKSVLHETEIIKQYIDKAGNIYKYKYTEYLREKSYRIISRNFSDLIIDEKAPEEIKSIIISSIKKNIIKGDQN